MCVMSMVYDDFSKRIPADFTPPAWVPTGTIAAVSLMSQPSTAAQVEALRQEVATLRALITDFHEAVKAAATVDRLTRQPDCFDPEKAKLEARVRELEAKLSAVQSAISDAGPVVDTGKDGAL